MTEKNYVVSVIMSET